MRFVIAYDITNDKARSRVYKILESYGAWKQYSVFELEITDVQLLKLKDEISSVISNTDRIRIYTICGKCVDKIINVGQYTSDKKSNIL